MNDRRLHLHGPGRAGTSLSRLLMNAGWTVVALSGGSERGADTARAVVGRVPWSPAPEVSGADLVVLGVPDDALGDTARSLVGVGAGTLVVHLSGIVGADALAPLADTGARLGAFHPLRSFPSREPADADLDGALVAVEAEEPVAAELEGLATEIGGRPFRLKPEGRLLYHFGASTMSNALLAVVALADRALDEAGVPADLRRDGLRHLAAGTLENYRRLGPAEALTGPWVRGDVGVLALHLEAVRDLFPEDVALHGELLRGLGRLRDVPSSRRWLDEEDV